MTKYLLTLLSCLWGASAFAIGTIGGDGFKHFTNRAFDFHVAIPADWTCEGCDHQDAHMEGSGEMTVAWTLKPADSTTHLNVSFISGFPAQTEDELLAAIIDRTGQKDWYALDRGDNGANKGFIGWSNSPLLDGANEATEYYLIDRQMVIRLDWAKDGSSQSRALQLDAVKSSIDRASAPPRVKGVKSEGAVVVKPGDQACLRIEVDDLRRQFTASSLNVIDFTGIPSHMSLKRSVEWLSAEAAFRVCVDVNAAFGPDGLQVNHLEIEGDSGESLNCSKTDTTLYQLSCGTSSSTAENGPKPVIITPKIAVVANTNPDHEGPSINTFSYDEQTQSVHLAASDRSGVFAAQIFMEKRNDKTPSTYAYPDQLTKGEPIDISAMVTPGWNKITSVVVYDIFGNATLLRLTKDGLNYELVPWGGVPEPSSIPVINFLKGLEARK